MQTPRNLLKLNIKGMYRTSKGSANTKTRYEKACEQLLEHGRQVCAGSWQSPSWAPRRPESRWPEKVAIKTLTKVNERRESTYSGFEGLM